MLSLYDELISVTGAMQKAGIPCLLVGGLAYTLLVEVRATEDIDFLIRPESWDAVKAALEPVGFRDLASPMDFRNVRIRRLTKLDDESVLVIDFLLADPPHDCDFDNAWNVQVGGVTIPVAPPARIIALKEGRMSDKDRSDIEGLRKLLRGENDAGRDT